MTDGEIEVAVVLDMDRYMIEHLSERYTVHYWPDRKEHARVFAHDVLSAPV